MTVAKDGFETTISVPQYTYVEVQALDASGQSIGSTGMMNYVYGHLV